MYFSAVTDATGEPVSVNGVVDLTIGTPPSVNPALVDPNSGQLIQSAIPVQAPAKMNIWLSLALVAAGAYLLHRVNKHH